MKFKLTSLEKKWVLYDIANSAFTLLVATIMPIYFGSLAKSAQISDVDYLAYWGYATSAVTILVAFLGPILGTMSDTKGRKKIYFMISVFIGAISCAALGFMQSWWWFLLLFVFAKSAYQLSLVFYDAMLTDITIPERMDEVSSQGYAWGYIGSCIPFVLCLVMILMYDKIGISSSLAMILSFILIAVWWLLLTIPLFRSYQQIHYEENRNAFQALSKLKNIFRELKENRKVFLFLIAFFFYIDGVQTIIEMATAYGTALGFDATTLLLALLFTQIVAFPAALFFGRLSKRYSAAQLINICIFGYLAIAIYAIFLREVWQFWIMAFFVALFQGAIQSLSRSYFAKIIPAEKSGEYFGIYDICGKGAVFLGTMLTSVLTQITRSESLGISILSLMFVVGYYFFKKADQL